MGPELRLTDFQRLVDSASRAAWVSQSVTSPATGETLRSQAQTLIETDLPQALTTLQALMEAMRPLPQALRGYGAWAFAIALRAAARYEESLATFRQARADFLEGGAVLTAARTVIGQVATLEYLARYAEAEAEGEAANAVFQAHGATLDAARLELNLGLIWLRQDQPHPAVPHLTRARAAFEAAGEQQLLAMTDVNLAAAYVALDNFRGAEHLYEQAREVFRALGVTRRVVQTEINLGVVWLWQGNYRSADQRFEAVRPLLETQGLSRELAYVDWHQSRIRLAFNLLDEALTLVSRAATQFAALGLTQEQGLALMNQALIIGRQGDYPGALAGMQQAREALVAGGHTPMLAWVESHAADLALAQHDLDTALQAATRAVTAFQAQGNEIRAAQAMILQGEALLGLGDLEAAEAAFQAALGVLQARGLPWMRYRAHYGLGRLRLTRRDRAGATEALRAAVSDVEAVHTDLGLEEFKVGYFGDKLAVYEALVSLCLDDEDPTLQALALGYVERAKSRALLDRLLAQGSDNELLGDAEQLGTETAERMASLREELSWLYNRLSTNEVEGGERRATVTHSLHEALLSREQELRLIHRRQSLSKGWQRRGQQADFTVEALQRVLPVGTAMIEFYTLNDEIVVFALDRTGLTVVREVASVAAVQLELQRLHFQLGKFRLGSDYTARHGGMMLRTTDSILQNLGQALLAPLRTHLDRAEHLIVVPHGPLHALPFHALLLGTQSVSERWCWSYAPSASVLLRCLTHTPMGGEGALVMGLPDARIPRVREEVAAVAACLPGAQVYLDEAATSDRLRTEAGQRRVVHLATHGLFRADNPLFSAIKLADGWMSLADIYNLTLPGVELVTLSACETGAGQVSAGDELIGLSRAFFATGTPTLVVSLWPVDDQAAASLMSRFYAGLRDGLATADALREAQLDVRRTHPHPYFWAPFVLLGRPR